MLRCTAGTAGMTSCKRFSGPHDHHPDRSNNGSTSPALRLLPSPSSYTCPLINEANNSPGHLYMLAFA